MKNLFVIILCVFTLAACQQSSNNGAATTKKVATKKAANHLLNAQAFKNKMDALNQKQIIDLRTHGELHRIGPIPGARNIDFQKPNFNQIAERFNKDVPTFVYCASGGRSASAYKKMKAMGFKEVYDLKGGITAWQKAGLPIQAHHH